LHQALWLYTIIISAAKGKIELVDLGPLLAVSGDVVAVAVPLLVLLLVSLLVPVLAPLLVPLLVPVMGAPVGAPVGAAVAVSPPVLGLLLV
jgi:hypothetical protein